nr:hypothetical protein [Kribbella qitaiheensis]
MEALADRDGAIRQRGEEDSGDVGRVDVLDGLEAEVGQCQLGAVGKLPEDAGIEIAGWIDGHPAGSADVSWMNDRHG